MIDIKISKDEYDLFCIYIKKVCGIHLDASKDYLVQSRLYKFLDITGSTSFLELYKKAISDSTNALQNQIIDAITTNETYFFRDSTPFDMLRQKIIPDIVESHKKSGMNTPLSLDIWSAACSTGQEVYTIGMILKEIFGDMTTQKVTILGTDISTDAIAKAKQGIYNDIEMERGLEISSRDRHFTHTSGIWKINDNVRSLAKFEQFNLFNSYMGKGPFDVIFCRNVAIYFDDINKKSVFDRLGSRLKPGGYLVIGSTESIGAICPMYESHRHNKSIYYQIKN